MATLQAGTDHATYKHRMALVHGASSADFCILVTPHLSTALQAPIDSPACTMR